MYASADLPTIQRSDRPFTRSDARIAGLRDHDEHVDYELSQNAVSIDRPDFAGVSRLSGHNVRMRIGYARVSTFDQSTDLQTDALSQSGCEKIFTEVASGAKADRPELAKVIDYLRKGDTLVVWKLDRLARSMSQLIGTINELEARGIGFHSLTEAIDTSTSTGKFTFNIFAALAAFERELIKDRTQEGLRAAAARGRRGGRPRALSDEQKRMALAMLKVEDITAKQIAEQLGIGRSTLYRHIPEARKAAKDAA
jgi:DNA invertase Pin-like site-specific DNA recombinase